MRSLFEQRKVKRFTSIVITVITIPVIIYLTVARKSCANSFIVIAHFLHLSDAPSVLGSTRKNLRSGFVLPSQELKDCCDHLRSTLPLSVCLCLYQSVCLHVSVSICLCMSVSVSLSVCLTVSVCLSFYLSVCLCQPVCVSLSVYLSVCVSKSVEKTRSFITNVRLDSGGGEQIVRWRRTVRGVSCRTSSRRAFGGSVR